MKRYFAFHGQVYYPSGGMGDFIGDFDTEDAAYKAILAAEGKPAESLRFKFTWGEIWDSHTRSIIKTF